MNPSSASAPAQPASGGVPRRISHRSRPVLIVAVVLSAVLVAGVAMFWTSIGPLERAQWNVPQVVTVLLLVVILVGTMLGIGLSRVVADDRGVTVTNFFRTRHYPWDVIEAITMSPGDAFAYLLLRSDDADLDGESKLVLAIQRAEGEASVERELAGLRAMLRSHH